MLLALPLEGLDPDPQEHAPSDGPPASVADFILSRDMDAAGTFGVALAGGSVGTIITLLSGVPEQVKRHNRIVEERDEDQGQWVSDECVVMERELEREKNQAARSGQLYAGAHLREMAHIKEAHLHAYRDQEREAQRERAALLDSEGWRHRAWRFVARYGPLPPLRKPEEVQPVLEAWREEVNEDGNKAPVSDPTKRPLEWAIRKYGKTTQDR
jgi:hypothetical protein